MTDGELQKRIKETIPKRSSNFWGKYSEGVRDGCKFALIPVNEAKQEFYALFPEEELGGTIKEFIQVLEELIQVQKQTSIRMKYQRKGNDERILKILKTIQKWFGGHEE